MEQYGIWLLIAVICILCVMRILGRNILIRWIGKAGICGALILVLNALLPQYAIAFNGYTFGFAAVMGMPGVMTMYIVKMIL